MTPAQFTALARLIRSRGGDIEAAARRVLVDGARQADVARERCIAPAKLNDAVGRYRRAHALALTATTADDTSEPAIVS